MRLLWDSCGGSITLTGVALMGLCGQAALVIIIVLELLNFQNHSIELSFAYFNSQNPNRGL
jgi:hypothetical protein